MGVPEFRKFGHLPREIRDMIWDFAIRPNVPGIHYFSVFNSDNENEWSAMERHCLHAASRTLCGLAAPACSADNKYSWTASNPSSYMIDSGLWTACKESRDRMLRHYKPEYWRPKLASYSFDGVDFGDRRAWKEFLDAPASGVFTTESGEIRLLTTFPRKDLFCLRPVNPETIDWEDIFAGRVPFFARRFLNVAYYVAIELDPTWIPQIMKGETVADGEVVASGMLGAAMRLARGVMHGPRCLYFIDRRIRWPCESMDGIVVHDSGTHLWHRPVFRGSECDWAGLRVVLYQKYHGGHTVSIPNSSVLADCEAAAGVSEEERWSSSSSFRNELLNSLARARAGNNIARWYTKHPRLLGLLARLEH